MFHGFGCQAMHAPVSEDHEPWIVLPMGFEMAKLAEGAGFEPAVSVTPRSISSRVP